MSSVTRTAPVSTGDVAKRGAVAWALALLVNLAVGWVVLTADLVNSTEFFQYPAIAVWTTLGIGGATVVYRLLSGRSETPDRTFRRVAIAVLGLSFLPDLALAVFADPVTTSEALGLVVLHFPPAVAALLILPGRLTFER